MSREFLTRTLSQNVTLLSCSLSNEGTDRSVVESEPDWVMSHVRKEKRKSQVQKKVDLETRLASIRAKELKQKQRYESGQSFRKRQVSKLSALNSRTHSTLENGNGYRWFFHCQRRCSISSR